MSFNATETELALLPTGAGDAKTLRCGEIACSEPGLLPDGKRVLFYGFEAGLGPRLYVKDLPDGKPRPITPEGIPYSRIYPVSPDGRFVALRGVDQKPAIFPVDGEAPLSIPGTDTNDYPGQWAGDGRAIYLYRPEELPCRVFRVDVATGRRELYREIVPPDPAGLIQVSPVIPTHDGKAYAYSYHRVLSDLYLVEGLR